MARLPGGLPVWRSRRLLGNPPAPAVPALPRVDASRHAALHSVVLEALKHADAPPPRSVHLGGTPAVRTADGVLVIGLPLVWGLSADQLRVLLTHELTLPPSRHPELVRALLDAREPAAGPSAGSAKAEARRARLLTATTPLLAEAEQVRDAAAITAAGGGLSAVEDAALSLLRAAATALAFTAFASSPLPPGPPLRAADLHEAWRLRLSRWGAPAGAVDAASLRADVAARHPGLAEELRTTHDDRSLVVADPDAVAVDLADLDADAAQTLAAEALDALPSPPPGADWVRLADLPVDSYLPDVQERAREYVEAVETVLGRSPDSRDELAGTLLRRPTAVERARRGLPADDEPESAPPWMGAALLAVVVEYTLLRKGWRREHPLLPRRLTPDDSDGAVLDLNELVRSDPAALRAHLG